MERIGSDVDHVAEGDHVLLSFASCDTCSQCNQGRPAYCKSAYKLNFAGLRADGSHTFAMDGQDVFSPFFGQSSFAQRALVKRTCIIKVDKHLPLDVLCPLGCGVLAGAGTLINELKPEIGHSVAVYGAGAVGLAAIMAAARLTPATKVIAIDIMDSKLEMAKELGATHVINSKTQDVIEQINAITKGEGTDRALDSTGDVKVIEVMIQAAASSSSVASVGARAGAEVVEIKPSTWLAKNVHYTGTCGGSASPHSVGLIVCCLMIITHSYQFIPALIELWQEGRFPIDRLLTRYPFAEINQALTDIHSGKTIKAVLMWD